MLIKKQADNHWFACFLSAIRKNIMKKHIQINELLYIIELT